MSQRMTALLVAAGLGIAGSASAQMTSPMSPSTPMTKDGCSMAKKRADAQVKADRDACSPQSGNARDIRVAEAMGKESVAQAEADYIVAIEKCDALAGSAKVSCVSSAKVQFGRS